MERGAAGGSTHRLLDNLHDGFGCCGRHFLCASHFGKEHFVSSADLFGILCCRASLDLCGSPRGAHLPPFLVQDTSLHGVLCLRIGHDWSQWMGLLLLARYSFSNHFSTNQTTDQQLDLAEVLTPFFHRGKCHVLARRPSGTVRTVDIPQFGQCPGEKLEWQQS